jgi:polyisoprenoid-binding protein YceI
MVTLPLNAPVLWGSVVASVHRRRRTVKPFHTIVLSGALLVSAALLNVSLCSASETMGFAIDPDHSSITLTATHLGIGTIQGQFDRFSGRFRYDPQDLAASSVSVEIQTSSINTNQAFRDKHLRSADFLDVEKYPEITFESTEVSRPDPDHVRIVGDLTLHGVTRPVTLLAKLGGMSQDSDGRNRVAFNAATDINRKDFGILWNQVVGSSMVVGQMVQINLNIEGVR